MSGSVARLVSQVMPRIALVRNYTTTTGGGLAASRHNTDPSMSNTSTFAEDDPFIMNQRPSEGARTHEWFRQADDDATYRSGSLLGDSYDDLRHVLNAPDDEHIVRSWI